MTELFFAGPAQGLDGVSEAGSELSVYMGVFWVVRMSECSLQECLRCGTDVVDT